MDVNTWQMFGLEELFEDNDKILEVADILDTLNLTNPWCASLPAAAEPAKSSVTLTLALTAKGLALATNIVIYLLCASVITVALILRFSGYNDAIFGYHIYHVVSGSMTPTAQADGVILKGGFRENDAIIVKNTVAEHVKRGDVITFWQNDEHRDDPITHRVMEVLNNGGSDISFVTKGDANPQEDPEPMPGTRLIGVKLVTLPRLGGALKTAQAHPWITTGVSLGVMAAVFAVFFVTNRRAGKKVT